METMLTTFRQRERGGTAGGTAGEAREMPCKRSNCRFRACSIFNSTSIKRSSISWIGMNFPSGIVVYSRGFLVRTVVQHWMDDSAEDERTEEKGRKRREGCITVGTLVMLLSVYTIFLRDEDGRTGKSRQRGLQGEECHYKSEKLIEWKFHTRLLVVQCCGSRLGRVRLKLMPRCIMTGDVQPCESTVRAIKAASHCYSMISKNKVFLKKTHVDEACTSLLLV